MEEKLMKVNIWIFAWEVFNSWLVTQLVTQPKIHVSAAYCTLCVLYVTFGLQLSQSFLHINIKTDEALYG